MEDQCKHFWKFPYSTEPISLSEVEGVCCRCGDTKKFRNHIQQTPDDWFINQIKLDTAHKKIKKGGESYNDFYSLPLYK